MKKILFPYVILPALLLGLVTILRAWMEVQSPESTATKLLSATVLSLIWTVSMPTVMLKKGLTLVQALLAGFVFFVLHRLFIGAVYAMAWAGKWTVEGTDEPVRYVKQIQDQSPDASTMAVFLGGNTFFPVGFGLVFLFVLWTITWAIGFRGKRPFAGGGTTEQAAAE